MLQNDWCYKQPPLLLWIYKDSSKSLFYFFFFFPPKICIEGRGKAQGAHPWKIFLKLFLKSENKPQRFFFFFFIIYSISWLKHTHTHTHTHTLNSVWACRMPTCWLKKDPWSYLENRFVYTKAEADLTNDSSPLWFLFETKWAVISWHPKPLPLHFIKEGLMCSVWLTQWSRGFWRWVECKWHSTWTQPFHIQRLRLISS